MEKNNKIKRANTINKSSVIDQLSNEKAKNLIAKRS
jgi:hypothetical protein